MWQWPLIKRKTYLSHTGSLSDTINAMRKDRDEWEQVATHLGREIDKVKIKASDGRMAVERAEHLARLHHDKVGQLEKELTDVKADREFIRVQRKKHYERVLELEGEAAEPLIKYDPSLKVSEVVEPDFKAWWEN